MQVERPSPFGPSADPRPLRQMPWGRAAALISVLVIALSVLFWFARSGQQDRPATDRAAPPPSTTELVLQSPDPAPPSPPRLDLGAPLWLFYGGGDPLQRIDLTGGTVESFGIRALPIHTVGDELILSTPDIGRIGRVGLHDPGEQAQGWHEARVAATPSADRLWLYSPDDEQWTGHDLINDQIVERRAAPGTLVDGPRADYQHLLIPDPGLITTPSGIYYFDGGEYARLGFGRVLATIDGRALIESCGDVATDCTTSWISSDDGQPSSNGVPYIDAGTPARISSVAVLGDGHWLHVLRLDASSQLLSTKTNTAVNLDPSLKSITVSPDGQWLATLRDDDDVEFFDLVSGEMVGRLAPFLTEAGGTLLLVAVPADLQN